MLKHIKKKTVEQFVVTQDVVDKMDAVLPSAKSLIHEQPDFEDIHKSFHAILLMGNNEKLRAYFYNNNGKSCMVPIANPVLIYFHTAQINLSYIYATRVYLLSLYESKADYTEKVLNEFFRYFGLTGKTTHFGPIPPFLIDPFHVPVINWFVRAGLFDARGQAPWHFQQGRYHRNGL